MAQVYIRHHDKIEVVFADKGKTEIAELDPLAALDVAYCLLDAALNEFRRSRRETAG
jgi:hypothetical protein